MRRERTPVFYGWWMVAACFLVAALAWSMGFFGTGIYLRAATAAFGWPVATVSAGITLFYFTGAVSLFLVGSTMDRHGPRPVMAFGGIALGLGFAALGFADAQWQIFPVLFVMGLGWACVSTTALSTALSPWFDRRQGQAVTMAMMGANVGGVVGAPALLFGIETVGLRTTFLAGGLASMASILALAAFVLRHRPEDIGLRPDGASGRADGAVAALPRRWTHREAIRTTAWRTVALAFAIGMMVQIGFNTHQVSLLAPSIGTMWTGVTVSATAAAALLGRVALARYSDRVDVRVGAALVLVMQATALAAMAAVPSPAMLIAGSIVYGFGIGNVSSLSPIIVRREFGPAAFGAIYGAAATIIQVASSLGPSFYGTIRDGLGGYGPALALAAGLNVVAAAIAFAGRPAPEPAAARPAL